MGADQSRSKLDAIGASVRERFPERTRAEDDLWTAEENGYRDGRIGVPIEDAPYEAGTELHAGLTSRHHLFW